MQGVFKKMASNPKKHRLAVRLAVSLCAHARPVVLLCSPSLYSNSPCFSSQLLLSASAPSSVEIYVKGNIYGGRREGGRREADKYLPQIVWIHHVSSSSYLVLKSLSTEEVSINLTEGDFSEHYV